MSGSSAVVGGIISLVLCVGSVLAVFLNRVNHPRRLIFFIVLAAIFLVAGIFLLVRGKAGGTGSAPAASK